MATGSTGGTFTVVVMISADAEWRSVRSMIPSPEVRTTPFGESFLAAPPASPRDIRVIYFHGGWGKIAAAASTQYAIDRWQPDLLVNLGTCGGFTGLIEPGEIVLASSTRVYDILEQMGDPDEALAHYATEIDLTWLGDSDPSPVRRVALVSGDRDLLPEDIPVLTARYGAMAGDWESGAIAWVAARNRIRCLILRAVTDLVGESGGDAYDGTLQTWSAATERAMRVLVAQLPPWLERAANGHVSDGTGPR